MIQATVEIDRETCKGCVLCIPVCPPKVLEMSVAVNAKGYRYPLLLDGCTGCELCAKVCPDFCFVVYRAVQPSEDRSRSSGADRGGE